MTPAKQAPIEQPLPYEGSVLGECDCCGKKDRELTRCFAHGIETFACEECRS